MIFQYLGGCLHLFTLSVQHLFFSYPFSHFLMCVLSFNLILCCMVPSVFDYWGLSVPQMVPLFPSIGWKDGNTLLKIYFQLPKIILDRKVV